MRKVVIVGFISVLLVAACDNPDKRRNQAVGNATIYAAQTGTSVIDCSSQDSDKNGYVSCDLKTATGAILKVECGYGGNTGCKTK